MHSNNFAREFLLDDQVTGKRTFKAAWKRWLVRKDAWGQNFRTLDLSWTSLGIPL